MKNKMIRISDKTHQDLSMLKVLKKHKSIDETIQYLIDAEHISEWDMLEQGLTEGCPPKQNDSNNLGGG